MAGGACVRCTTTLLFFLLLFPGLILIGGGIGTGEESVNDLKMTDACLTMAAGTSGFYFMALIEVELKYIRKTFSRVTRLVHGFNCMLFP